MKRYFPLIISLAFILTSCSTGPGAVKIFGIPMGYTTWGLHTGEYAKLYHPEEFCENSKECEEISQRSLHSKLDGVSWGLSEGTEDSDLESEFAGSYMCMDPPLQKEKLINSRYSEKWIYPYAFVYFKRSIFGKNKVTNVEFREDEIKKLKGPIKIDIHGIYK